MKSFARSNDPGPRACGAPLEGSALLLAHLVFIAKGYVRAREFGKDESFHVEEAVL